MPGAKGTLIAEGAYSYESSESATGHESWSLEKLGHGGLVITTHGERNVPSARFQFTFELTQNWVPVQFSARIDSGDRTLITGQRVVDARWLARVESPGQEPVEAALDFTPKHEISYPSPVFEMAALYRLNLQVGQSSPEIDAIAIDGSTLVARTAKRQVSCVAEEKIEVPAGEFVAWRYSIKTADSQAQDEFWADRNGIVLLFKGADGHVAKLLRRRRVERR
ncbi:MAG: hypothetical protein M1482_07490 [Chloroflexi bacterium]|nr:hypothetical protein [Chloroflexota bacterium]